MPQNKYLPEGMLLDSEPNRACISTPQALARAAESGVILEAPAILCDAAHDLIVDLPCMKGIIPRADAAIGMENGQTKEIAIISRVGRPVCFKAVSIDEDGGLRRALLSRRAAQEEALAFFMDTLQPGDIVRACVTHLEPFGAFVDIGCGITSLIGIENISVSRLPHPSERFSVGQMIYAAVTGIDRERCRIMLSHKELLGTWEQNAAMFRPGETVRGIVRDTPDYGVFVELTPNLSGLAERRDELKAGQHVSVYIKSIIPERMKIKLIVIDRLDRPQPMPIHYFLPESGHAEVWRYTPEGCTGRLVETRFV